MLLPIGQPADRKLLPRLADGRTTGWVGSCACSWPVDRLVVSQDDIYWTFVEISFGFWWCVAVVGIIQTLEFGFGAQLTLQVYEIDSPCATLSRLLLCGMRCPPRHVYDLCIQQRIREYDDKLPFAESFFSLLSCISHSAFKLMACITQ